MLKPLFRQTFHCTIFFILHAIQSFRLELLISYCTCMAVLLLETSKQFSCSSSMNFTRVNRGVGTLLGLVGRSSIKNSDCERHGIRGVILRVKLGISWASLQIWQVDWRLLTRKQRVYAMHSHVHSDCVENISDFTLIVTSCDIV